MPNKTISGNGECRGAGGATAMGGGATRLPALVPVLARAWARVGRMLRVHGERQVLARLDERTLRDIGITSEARRRELARPFWDIP